MKTGGKLGGLVRSGPGRVKGQQEAKGFSFSSISMDFL